MGEEKGVRVRKVGVLSTVLILYFFAPEFGAISPTLALMPEYYNLPASTVSWISAFANPSACVAGLCIGAFVGKKISYRACAIAATFFYTVFGGLPFLWQGISFPMLLMSRALFGLGCGCLVPLSQAVITHMFESETARSAWIGIVNIVFSVGASVGSMITGALSAGGIWQHAYGFYLLCAVPFVMALSFFHDRVILSSNRPMQEAIGHRDGAPSEKRFLPRVAVLFICVFTLCTVLSQTFFNYAGIAMAESGCDTLLIGTVFTVFTVAGVAVAAANAGLWRLLRLWNFPLAFLLITVGYALCIVGYGEGGIAWFFAASVLMGAGCCIAGMVMPMVMSVTCSAASLTLAIGLQEVARNAGSFLSAPWINAIAALFGDTSSTQFMAAAILGLIAVSLAVLLALRYSKKLKGSRGEENFEAV